MGTIAQPPESLARNGETVWIPPALIDGDLSGRAWRLFVILWATDHSKTTRQELAARMGLSGRQLTYHAGELIRAGAISDLDWRPY